MRACWLAFTEAESNSVGEPEIILRVVLLILKLRIEVRFFDHRAYQSAWIWMYRLTPRQFTPSGRHLDART